MRILLLLLGISFMFFACNNATAPSKDQSNEGQVLKTTAVSPEHASFPVPVYTTFESLEPIFQKENDTTYIINFWATWCKPCVKELPYFEQLRKKYKKDKVEVVLVSLDFARDLEKKLLPFLEDRKLQSKVVVLLDGNYNNWIDKVDPSWSGAIPATLVYQAESRTFMESSIEDFEELDEMLQTVL